MHGTPGVPCHAHGQDHKRIQAFTQALRTRLLDRASGFGKQYLKLLVDEIRIEGNRAEMTGSYAALAAVVAQGGPDTNKGTAVPRFMPDWRPQGGSNPCCRRERAES